MKLRLPNALKVALMAATSGLVFTTLSTGSGLTAVAVGAAILSQPAAAATTINSSTAWSVTPDGYADSTYTVTGSNTLLTITGAIGSAESYASMIELVNGGCVTINGGNVYVKQVRVHNGGNYGAPSN